MHTVAAHAGGFVGVVHCNNTVIARFSYDIKCICALVRRHQVYAVGDGHAAMITPSDDGALGRGAASHRTAE